MLLASPIIPENFCLPYGTDDVDHLVADGAGFTGAEVAVVALLEVDAYLVGALHLKAVHGVLRLGNVDLIIVSVRHGFFSLFHLSQAAVCLRISPPH